MFEGSLANVDSLNIYQAIVHANRLYSGSKKKTITISILTRRIGAYM